MSIPKVKDLLVMVLARIDELAAGETFCRVDYSSGEMQQTQVGLTSHMYRLPEKSGVDSAPMPFPYLVAYKMPSEETEELGRVTIRLVIGLYNNTDLLAGEDDVERVMAIVFGLLQDQDFTPWSLEAPLKYGPVDEDGIQPHPEYFVYADLVFIRGPLFLNT